jgi:hypothetical protein
MLWLLIYIAQSTLRLLEHLFFTQNATWYKHKYVRQQHSECRQLTVAAQTSPDDVAEKPNAIRRLQIAGGNYCHAIDEITRQCRAQPQLLAISAWQRQPR